MCDDGCDNCARLEAENAQLRREITALLKIIEELKRKLEAIRRYCEKVLRRTRAILSQKSGVKFSKWKFAEGADSVASTVQKIAG